MSINTCRQTISSAKRQIASTKNAISDSRKRINKVKLTVSTSKKTIDTSNYYFSLTVLFLTNYLIIDNLKELTNFLDLEATQNIHKNEGETNYLTPQENLEQIMTHPFKTGLCPYCGHLFPKAKNWSVNWNCLACGWSDSLFRC